MIWLAEKKKRYDDLISWNTFWMCDKFSSKTQDNKNN